MEDIDLEQLGRRIRRLREARHMKQDDLALLLDVTVKTVGNWERGKNFPKGRMGALEKVFGVDDLLAEVITQEDAVAAAIGRSQLSRSDKATLLGTYYRMLDGVEERGA